MRGLRRFVLAGVAFGLAMALGSSAHAASLCVPGPNDDELDITDVTLGGINASNCYGLVDGNNSGNTDINAVDGGALLFGGSTWGDEIKDAGANTGEFFGVTWTLDAELDETAGTWTLSFEDATPSILPFFADILVILKGDNEYAAYLFDDFLFEMSSESGTYTMYVTEAGNSGNTHTPGLSHMSVYFREGMSVPDPDPDPVPEPTALILFGAGLFGMATRAVRRRM